MTQRDFAILYAGWGWPVLPCHWIDSGLCSCGDPECRSPGKHPFSKLVPRGLHQASADLLVVGAWWDNAPNANIAIRTGGPAHLVVLDIDDAPGKEGSETLREWEKTHGALPSTVECLTGGGGRHLYFTSPALVASGTDVLGQWVDVRGEGGYVLAPGSNHVSGHAYEWELSQDPEEGARPATIPKALLDALTQRAPTPEPVATPCALLPSEKVAELRSALACIPADGRNTWLQVGMALQSTRAGEQAFGLWTEWSQTSEKFDPKDQRRTWRSFKPDHGVTLSTLFWTAQGFGWVPPVEAQVSQISTTEPRAELTPPKEVPAELLTLPGVLGEFVEWMNRTAIRPQPQFAVQAALALGSVTMGRLYRSDRRNWPVLYLLNVGPSGCGKEHAKTCLDRVLYDAGFGHLVNGTGYTSTGAVFSSLRDRPAHLTVIDELGRMLGSAKAAGNYHKSEMLTTLMEAYGRCDGMMQPPTYSTMGLSPEQREKTKTQSIWNPSLTLLGMTTPRTFYGSVSSEEVRNGFLNRFVIVESVDGRVPSQNAPDLPPPERVIEWIKTVRARRGNLPVADLGTLRPTPALIPFSAPAIEAADQYEHEILTWQGKLEQNSLDDLLTRVREIAMRIATVLAVACDTKTPVIRPEHMGWAIGYTRYYAAQVVTAAAENMADSPFEKLKQTILRALRQVGSRGVTTRDMGRNAPFRSIPLRERSEALTALLDAGLVRCERSVGPRGGRPSDRYYHGEV